MTEKIEWYKEVLELEPNSKVFFPLARLLAEAKRIDEAVEILEQGLARHEEFLEARLYLIELLHTANKLEACEKQVGRLTKMFSTYAGSGRRGPRASMPLAMPRTRRLCCVFWP